ncbi:hypothetical protein JZ751_029931 [Albula glossodonta]|uniref:Uncharacterized protein n=1 Tax=Albula glossodonta TaxID=121402 RepID=A0A8T2MUR2_9TELE|nr:hypothetical protein JZ751_029931 [Albula glossodonta]
MYFKKYHIPTERGYGMSISDKTWSVSWDHRVQLLATGGIRGSGACQTDWGNSPVNFGSQASEYEPQGQAANKWLLSESPGGSPPGNPGKHSSSGW